MLEDSKIERKNRGSKREREMRKREERETLAVEGRESV